MDWQSEKGCFQTFCHEIALLYVIEPPSVENPTSSSTSSHPPLSNSATSEAEDVANITAFEEAPEVATHRSLVSNVLFPAFKKFGFIATKDMVDAGLAVQLADLPELYKIFERC